MKKKTKKKIREILRSEKSRDFHPMSGLLNRVNAELSMITALAQHQGIRFTEHLTEAFYYASSVPREYAECRRIAVYGEIKRDEDRYHATAGLRLDLYEADGRHRLMCTVRLRRLLSENGWKLETERKTPKVPMDGAIRHSLLRIGGKVGKTIKLDQEQTLAAVLAILKDFHRHILVPREQRASSANTQG